jgi:ATP-dependent Lon protease
MPQLDQKANRVFAGKVVRKDLVRRVKVGANVPTYVLEYLLGRYCASDDQTVIDVGLQVVNATLTENYVRPDEATKAQVRVREKGSHTFIDKVKVRFVASEDKYWAELTNFGDKYVHIPDEFVRRYERIVEGGIWAQVDMEYRFDESQGGKRSPFWIRDLKPIQLATFDLGQYREGRAQFTADEWLDFIVRAIGLEPSKFERRLKLLYLSRLIPLCEANYNLVELGPRGTGKSFAFQELSPYAILLTGPTTVANLFYNMASGKVGLVGLWDAIAFDEVADLQKMPQEVVTTLKTYCESGTFARGKEAITAPASLAMFGNINQPVEVLVKSSHLFAPMPDVIRDDMAFLDRIHFYLPGWEIPKMQNEFLTDHYGFVVDYLAEALRELRKHNFTECVDRSFAFGSHLNTRDIKAVRRTISGMIKLLHPGGDPSKGDLEEIVVFALEGRRRVKEQLKKMAAFEFHQTSFSYIDRDTSAEKFVGVPEQGGRNLIAQDPLAPGTVYAADVGGDGRASLYRIEVGTSSGTGKLKVSGGVDGTMKEALQRAFAVMLGRKGDLGIASELAATDLHVEAMDLLSNRVEGEVGVAFFLAMYSALKKKPLLPALLVLGDLSVQGNIKPVKSLVELLQLGMENGGKRALVPTENKRHFLEVSGDIVEKVDPVFYSDLTTAAMKGLGVG